MFSIWISCKKSVKNILLKQKNLSSIEIKNEIKLQFKISQNKLLRLRKANGALVPIDKNLMNNSKNKPYELEIVNECTHEAGSGCNHKLSSSLIEVNFYFIIVWIVLFILINISNRQRISIHI